MRDVFFEEVIMFQLRTGGWAEMNWVEGTERQGERELQAEMKSMRVSKAAWSLEGSRWDKTPVWGLAQEGQGKAGEEAGARQCAELWQLLCTLS